jgi:hypothetical protein
MKFHELLQQRDALIRQTRLANVAFAYERLADFTARIARARLRGSVVLRAGDSGEGEPWPTLAAEEGSQAAIEEHFLEEDIIELADILAFLAEGQPPAELRFRLEDLEERVLPRLHEELAGAGITPRSKRWRLPGSPTADRPDPRGYGAEGIR